MRKTNYFKVLGVMAMLSPMAFSPNTLAQSIDQYDEAYMKAHIPTPAFRDNTYVDMSHINRTIPKDLLETKDIDESLSFPVRQETTKEISEVKRKPVPPKKQKTNKEIARKSITLDDNLTHLNEVKGLDMSQSYAQIQADLDKALKSADNQTTDKAKESLLDDSITDAVEVKGLDMTQSFVQTQEDLAKALTVVEVGQEVEVESKKISDTSTQKEEEVATSDRTNLEQVVCEQKDQIKKLTETIQELKLKAEAPFDSTNQILSQLMMMNQMMMQNQGGGYYQRAGSNYEIMNSYMQPMRMMSSMMLTNQQLMLSNMNGMNNSTNMQALSALSSGPTYNVSGDFYNGDYSMSSPQQFQVPLPQAMSVDYRNFGNIMQAPRTSPASTFQPAAAQNFIRPDTGNVNLPDTQLNNMDETV